MPPRPSAYRSFVTCSDPEGVVDCGTIRKSRLEKVENSIAVRQKMPKSLNMSCSSKGEMGLKNDVGVSGGNSSSQLAEIEKGAQKLNKMIESWAKGMSIDGQSKDIARDLLRGALDLQESLNMLSKLQEASLYMAKLKRLEKHKPDNFQKPRVSIDGSTRSNCVEELKRVIQDSFARQNLLPETSGESAPWAKRETSWATEVQSTSSSQSSVYFSKKVYSTDNSSVSSDISDKIAGRPNLIAKLMGLEDKKPMSASPNTANELQNERKVPATKPELWHAMPVFDINLPKATRPELVAEKRHQEKRTLRELLEATQSKAHFEIKRPISVLDQQPRYPRSNPRRSPDLPPIVIMKPIQTPYVEAENCVELRFKTHERRLDASEIIKELKSKNWFPPTQNKVPEREEQKSSTAEVLMPEKNKPLKISKLQSSDPKIKERAVVSSRQTPHVNKMPKTVNSQGVTNDSSKAVREKNRSAAKLLAPKNPPVTPSKPSKPEKNPIIKKTQTRSPHKDSHPTTSKPPKEAAKHYPAGMKKTPNKKEKSVTQSTPVGKVCDILGHKDDGWTVDFSCQDEPLSEETKSSLADPLYVEIKTNADTEIDENWRDLEVPELTSQSNHQERSNAYDKDTKDSISETISQAVCIKSRSFKKDLLLSSPSFAARVELLFNLDISESTVTKQPANMADQGEAEATLLISYANELIERRSHQVAFILTPLTRTVSLNQLLEEVCDGYDIINSYRHAVPSADVFDMLNRDMKCKEVFSSVWALGWKNGYATRETELLVANIEKLILGDFIDELFVH